MGYYKNLQILRQEERLGKEEPSDVLVENKAVKDELLHAFKVMKELLLSVKNIHIPYAELMLQNGNLSLFEKSKSPEKLDELEKQKKVSEQYFASLQEKRKFKSHDLPFIKSIYYDGFESDVWLEAKAKQFNENRSDYPYLNMTLPKRQIEAAELYDFAVNCLTRGYSEQRKNEKLAFQSAKANLKRINEQVSILKGKQTAVVKGLKEQLEAKLDEYWFLHARIEELAREVGNGFSGLEMFEAFVKRNAQTLDVDARRVWEVVTAQDFYHASCTPALKPQQVATLESVVANQPIVVQPVKPEPVKADFQAAKVSQLAFVLEGEDTGKIVEKQSKHRGGKEK